MIFAAAGGLYLAPRLFQRTAAVRGLRLAALLFILLTAISRVYLGEHWPSDVLGSFILGALVLIPAALLYQRWTGTPTTEPEVEDA